jgi:hypothetical protein
VARRFAFPRRAASAGCLVFGVLMMLFFHFGEAHSWWRSVVLGLIAAVVYFALNLYLLRRR